MNHQKLKEYFENGLLNANIFGAIMNKFNLISIKGITFQFQ